MTDAPHSTRNLRQKRPISPELHGGHSNAVSLIRELRAIRQDYFPAELLGEPGWDILLDLYEAQLAEFRLSVSTVCVGTGLPATTALRWLKTLENRGYVKRRADTADRRRVYVEATPIAMNAMEQLFNEIERRLAHRTSQS